LATTVAADEREEASASPQAVAAVTVDQSQAVPMGYEASDCTGVQIKWRNRTGNNVRVVSYEFGFAGKLTTKTPGAAGGKFEAKNGETWVSAKYNLEGADGMDAGGINVVYEKWVTGRSSWSNNTYRAKLTPSSPKCSDGKVYQTVILKNTDGAT